MQLFLHSLQQTDEHDSTNLLFGECVKVLKLEDQIGVCTPSSRRCAIYASNKRLRYFGCRGLGPRFSLSRSFHPYRRLCFFCLQQLPHESFGSRPRDEHWSLQTQLSFLSVTIVLFSFLRHSYKTLGPFLNPSKRVSSKIVHALNRLPLHDHVINLAISILKFVYSEDNCLPDSL